jgi:uncharacterized membrane protein
MFLQFSGSFALLIVLTLGMWASVSFNVNALNLHLWTLLPTQLYTLVWSCIALAQIHGIDKYIAARYENTDYSASELDALQARVKTMLLVAGESVHNTFSLHFCIYTLCLIPTSL